MQSKGGCRTLIAFSPMQVPIVSKPPMDLISRKFLSSLIPCEYRAGCFARTRRAVCNALVSGEQKMCEADAKTACSSREFSNGVVYTYFE